MKKQEEKNGIVVDENNMVSIFLSADDSKDEASPTDEGKDEDKGNDAPADTTKDDAKDDEMPGDLIKDTEIAQDKGKGALLLLVRVGSFDLMLASILTNLLRFIL